MRQPHWIIQNNLIKDAVLKQLKFALEANRISYEEVKVIPFSNEVPAVKNKNDFHVYYGSTTLILNAYKQLKNTPGIFYNEDLFTIENYMNKWGDTMLNADSKILTFAQIIAGNFKLGEWFVRPISDDKSFSGRIMNYEEMKQLESGLAESNNPYLNENTLVAISIPKEIQKEWRHFIVNGKVISSSKYAENGHLNKSSKDVPEALLEFVQERCKEYIPSPVFVMDTALHNNAFKIVECNCFNDTGFYDHNISAIIKAVNDFIIEHCLDNEV